VDILPALAVTSWDAADQKYINELKRRDCIAFRADPVSAVLLVNALTLFDSNPGSFTFSNIFFSFHR